MTLNAKIYGLVLSGGKSTRMGQDKGLIAYHGKPQREHLYNLLSGVCDQTFLSIRNEQKSTIAPAFKTIVDADEFKGPYNGLLTAHKKYPDVAWLVLACDLPLITANSLQELVQARNLKRHPLATAFALPKNPLPEPLCAIWEPEALKQSVAYLEAGNGSCPRKYLIQNKVGVVFPSEEHTLLNANSVEDYEKALAKIGSL